MNQNFIFVLNNQEEVQTPFDVKLLYKLGNEISQKIVSGKYYIQAKVSRESFETFLDYLNDRQANPELTVNNYYEFLLLSDEFNGILSEYLSKEEFEKIKILSIVKNAKTEEKRDLSFCEEYIASKLDYFLEFYSKEMSEMKTTTLYNIFQHEKRNLKNHERAYQFIKEQIENGKESDCVLLKTLDGIQMSEKSINETFSKKETNYGFLPEFNLSFISDIQSQMNSIMNQQIQMMNVINSMINEKINSIQDNYLLLTQKIQESNEKIDKIMTENEKIKNDIPNISQKVEENIEKINVKIGNLSQKIVELNDKIENGKTNEKIESLSQKVGNIESDVKKIFLKDEKIDKIITENEKTNVQIENLSQKVGNIERKVNETFTKSEENSREINDIKEKVDFIKRKSSEIETKCDNTHSCVLQNEKNNTKSFDTVCQYIKIFSANNGQFDGIIRQLTNECGGNVSDKGIVNVTMPSRSWGNLKDVVNLENTRTFGTGNFQDSWIKYDFKNKKVSPVCYLIRSCNYSKNWHHPKSWVVEGSNTDSPNDWKVLDSRKDCMSLNNPSVVQCFAIQQSSDFYRFLRIRQTDKDWSGNNYHFTMSTLEYFGFIQ